MFWLWNNLLTFLKTFLVFADGLPSTAVLCHWQIAHAVPRSRHGAAGRGFSARCCCDAEPNLPEVQAS